ncbi:MAG: hypothetical protein ACFFCQ_13830 [Promethearchaeota archaeon]
MARNALSNNASLNKTVEVGDFNGNGIDELIFLTNMELQSFEISNLDDSQIDLVWTWSAPSPIHLLCSADLNLDGYTELVVETETEGYELLILQYEPITTSLFPIWSFFFQDKIIASLWGFFDPDVFLDLCVITQLGEISLFESMNSDLDFGIEPVWNDTLELGSTPIAAGAVNLLNDEFEEIVIAVEAPSGVIVLVLFQAQTDNHLEEYPIRYPTSISPPVVILVETVYSPQLNASQFFLLIVTLDPAQTQLISFQYSSGAAFPENKITSSWNRSTSSFTGIYSADSEQIVLYLAQDNQIIILGTKNDEIQVIDRKDYDEPITNVVPGIFDGNSTHVVFVSGERLIEVYSPSKLPESKNWYPDIILGGIVGFLLIGALISIVYVIDRRVFTKLRLKIPRIALYEFSLISNKPLFDLVLQHFAVGGIIGKLSAKCRIEGNTVSLDYLAENSSYSTFLWVLENRKSSFVHVSGSFKVEEHRKLFQITSKDVRFDSTTLTVSLQKFGSIELGVDSKSFEEFQQSLNDRAQKMVVERFKERIRPNIALLILSFKNTTKKRSELPISQFTKSATANFFSFKDEFVSEEGKIRPSMINPGTHIILRMGLISVGEERPKVQLFPDNDQKTENIGIGIHRRVGFQIIFIKIDLKHLVKLHDILLQG